MCTNLVQRFFVYSLVTLLATTCACEVTQNSSQAGEEFSSTANQGVSLDPAEGTIARTFYGDSHCHLHSNPMPCSKDLIPHTHITLCKDSYKLGLLLFLNMLFMRVCAMVPNLDFTYQTKFSITVSCHKGPI